MKQRYIASKTENERENERFLKEQAELKNLRKSKIELTKKKELLLLTLAIVLMSQRLNLLFLLLITA